MIIRCRSKTGTVRYDLQPTDDISKLVEKILGNAPNADPSTLTLSNQPRGGESAVAGLTGSLSEMGIKHGDLLFVGYAERSDAANGDSTPHSGPSPTATNGVHPEGQQPGASATDNVKTAKKPWELVTEEPVDTFWEAQDGKIKRSRDPRMCRHGDKSMCDHCMPVEPYDAKYQAEHQIKHLSFHSYLRKLDISTNKATGSSANTFIPPLNEPDYRVTVPCPSESHPSWPAGICTKCQPSAVTLALQQYRMVDHVEFGSPALIEQLLQVWRRTGSQRFGWLLGHYEAYDQVPMGVKAVVEAIHEPPQEGDVDGLRLGMPWEDEGKIESLAQMCGLKIVGMIFTDLTPDPDPEKAKSAKSLHKRHKDSYFLSSLEAIFGAHQQIAHPNPSRFSSSGKFSSKFVTCVLTADAQGDIAVEAYQISDQAMAMVEADMIEASVEPGVVRIKEDTSDAKDPGQKRYIPDVFYTYKNQYNLQVKESAKPCFPTDYLLVSLTNGFPNVAQPLFAAPATSSFPVENRQGLHDQTPGQLYSRVNEIAKLAVNDTTLEDRSSASGNAKGKGRADGPSTALDKLVAWLSDWHLLVFLDTMGIFDKGEMKLLANVATRKDAESARALLKSTGWRSLVTIAAENDAPAQDQSMQSGAGNENEVPIFEYDAEGFPIIPEDHDFMRTDTRPASTAPIDVDAIPPELLADPRSGTHGGASTREAAPTAPPAPQPMNDGMVVCPHCTFENPPGIEECEMCALPLAG